MSNIQRGARIVRTIYFSPAEQDVLNNAFFQKHSPRGKESRLPIPSTPRWILDIGY